MNLVLNTLIGNENNFHKKFIGLIAFVFISFIQNSFSQIAESTDSIIICNIGHPPSFPGGDKRMIEFLKTNIVYPDSAIKKGIEGTVYVSFIIERDGTLSDIKIVRSVNKFLDTEALRVVRLMPAWNSENHNEENVRYLYTLPVKFRLKPTSVPNKN